MRLHVLADLHLEFGRVDIPETDADVTVCAGDVHAGTRGLEWIKSHFPAKPVIYVIGNHEFYHQELPALSEQLKREAEGTQVHVLENQAVELGGYRFLGCTLWTDFDLRGDSQIAMLVAQDRMNDYRIVRFSTANRTLRPDDTRKLHLKSVAWLKRELPRYDPARTIVVTHHAPSARSELRAYANGPLTPAFASNLDALVEGSGVPLWIHGHTHHNVDYRLGTTRVLTNQRGYPQEACVRFDPGMVVDV